MAARGDARDAQTDVSRTDRGVWYVISGQETKFGGWQRTRGPRPWLDCYEIHLIGEREREQQLYDLRSTMYFAIAIKGIAASP